MPPVKGSALYKESVRFDLFNDVFSITHLDEIMRQKDDANFAQLLNRLRIKKKDENLLQNDYDILFSCEVKSDDSEALHIFTRNVDVDRYNEFKLTNTCTNSLVIYAKDSIAKNSKKKNTKLPSSKHSFNCLPDKLCIGIGARVMMTKNVDTSDGMVNGAFGIVTHIITKPNNKFPLAIHVKFDNKEVGYKLRQQTPMLQDKESTPIYEEEEYSYDSEATQTQFPLKLAWACTVHKVQGLTVEKAVVSLRNVFQPGQAYVALNRVVSAKGLTIRDLNSDSIYCNENIEYALSKLPLFLPEKRAEEACKTNIIFFNIQGLRGNFKNLESDKRLMNADHICLVETWLHREEAEMFNINNYIFYSKVRSLCYNADNKYFFRNEEQRTWWNWFIFQTK